MARILADATDLGDKRTAERFGISTKTIQRYRADFAEDEAMSEQVAELKTALSRDWLDEAKRVRRRLLARLDDKADVAEIRDVAGALKIVHDAVLAEQIVSAGGVPGAFPGQSPGQRGFQPIVRAAQRSGPGEP